MAQFSGEYYKSTKNKTDRSKTASALATVCRNMSRIWKMNESKNIYEAGLVLYLLKTLV